MTEHTPTPYIATRFNNDWECARIGVSDGQVLADVFGYTPDEATQLAAFIVRACNNHAALVAALELAESALDNSLRSADTSTAGFIATRKLMARAHTTIRDSLAAVKEAGK